MRRRHNLWIPCEVFALEVVSAPQKGLSSLERLVLEAIWFGAIDLDQLNALFQLGHRPLLDLVSDLWRQGHLRIDIRRGRFFVTRSTREKLKLGEDGPVEPTDGTPQAAPDADADSEALEGGQRSFKTIELVHDLLCNELLPGVFPERLETKALERSIPPILDPGDYRKLPAVTLEQAAIERFGSQEDRERVEGRRQPHQLIHFSLPDAGRSTTTGELKYLHVQVELLRGSTGRLQIEAVGPSFLPTHFRRRLSRRLSEILEEGRGEGAQVLEQLFDGSEEAAHREVVALQRLVVELESRIAGLGPDLADLSREHAEERDKALQSLASDLLAELDQRREGQARVRWLRGRDALDEAIRSAISQARWQIVISSPQVFWRHLDRFYDLLEKRLEVDGIRVVILWGTTARSTLDTEIRNSLRTLGRAGNLQWSHRPHRTQASFVLRDADLGIFAGSAALADFPAGALAAVVRRADVAQEELQSTADSQIQEMRRELPRVGPVVDELARVQRTALEMHIEQAVVIPKKATKAPGLRERLPQLDPEIFTNQILDASAGLQAWADGWKYWLHRIEREIAELGPTATTVYDREHLEYFEAALRSDSPWLVLASGTISNRGFDRSRQLRIEQLVASGTRVLLIDGQRFELDPEIASSLGELSRRYPDGFRRMQLPLRGSVIATQRFFLLSSFELLDRPPRPTDDLARRRLESGLLVRSPSAIGDGLSKFFEDTPRALDFLRLEDAWPDRAPIETTELDPLERELSRTIHAIGRSKSLDRAREVWTAFLGELPEGTTPVEAFALGASRLADAGLKRGAHLQALERTPDLLTTEGGRQSLISLSRGLWKSGELFEAITILDALAPRELDEHGDPVDLDALPPSPLRHFLMAEGIERSHAALEVLDELPEDDPQAASAIACAAIPWLADSASGDAYDLLGHFQAAMPEAIRDQAESFRDFYRKTLRPVPWRALEALRQQRITTADQPERHLEAARMFENAENVSFNFDLGKHTWRRLFADDGAFGGLRQPLASEDLEAATLWLRAWDRSGSTAAQAMDTASQRAFEEVEYLQDALIVHRRRDNYVRRLDNLIDSVRDWIGPEIAELKSLDATTTEAARVLVVGWNARRTRLSGLVDSWDEATRYLDPLLRNFDDFLEIDLQAGRPDVEPLGLWSGHAWRYPALWIADRETALQPERVVRAIVRGLADPRVSEDQVLDKLLAEGRVGAALRLVARVEIDKMALLNRAAAGLRNRRLRLMDELRETALVSNSKVQEKLQSLAQVERTQEALIQAESLLLELEELLQGLAAPEAAEQRVEPLARASQADSPVDLPLIEETLSAAGRHLPAWIGSQSALETLRRFRENELPGWDPHAEATGARLVRVLTAPYFEGARFERGWAADVGDALDALLSREPGDRRSEEPRVERRDHFLVVVLRTLPSRWLPPLAGDSQGWELWIPTRKVEEVEPSDGSDLRLFFDPTFDARESEDIRPEWALRITPELVFRSLVGSAEHRRWTWLCEIGRQIPLDRILVVGDDHRSRLSIPAERDPLASRLFSDEAPHRLEDRAEARAVLESFFEVGGFAPLAASELDSIIALVGFHRFWIRTFLDDLCTWLANQGRGRGDLTAATLDEVWHGPRFQRTFEKILETLARDEPSLAYSLGLCVHHWVETPGDLGAPKEDIVRDNEYLLPAEFETNLLTLDARGLIILDSDRIEPPSGAIGSRLIDYLLDRLEVLEAQVRGEATS